jgi:hypothetical protein
MPSRTIDEFKAAIREERRQSRQAGADFAAACLSGDVSAFERAVYACGELTVEGWRHAFRNLLKIERVHPGIIKPFLSVWIENKSIARHFESDLPVVKALRKIFPPYTGEPVHLYRGEFHRAWKRRTYGIAWTADPEIAEKFATDTRQCSLGGSLIIETIAPPEAIIANMDAVGDYYSEREYLVDRRKLEKVRVYRRFPQLPADHTTEFMETSSGMWVSEGPA